jgi:transcriptional regulator with XRE-family HTH domain
VNAATLTSAIRASGSAKEIARAAGCSVATAARYRRGETMPDLLGLARLMGWSRAIANAMLRLAGLDDLSMDLEEARLRQELRRLEARRGGSPDVETAHTADCVAAGGMADAQGSAVKADDDLRARAIQRAYDALRDAERWRPLTEA